MKTSMKTDLGILKPTFSLSERSAVQCHRELHCCYCSCACVSEEKRTSRRRTATEIFLFSFQWCRSWSLLACCCCRRSGFSPPYRPSTCPESHPKTLRRCSSISMHSAVTFVRSLVFHATSLSFFPFLFVFVVLYFRGLMAQWRLRFPPEPEHVRFGLRWEGLIRKCQIYISRFSTFQIVWNDFHTISLCLMPWSNKISWQSVTIPNCYEFTNKISLNLGGDLRSQLNDRISILVRNLLKIWAVCFWNTRVIILSMHFKLGFCSCFGLTEQCYNGRRGVNIVIESWL